jgi:hypothetical protein
MPAGDPPRPEEPTSGPRPVVRRGLADGPPPRPPRPLPTDEAAEQRAFEVDGVRWVAVPGGHGTTGTGAYGLGLVEAIHFRRPERSERPEREALLPAGRFHGLYDEELCTLLAGAREVVQPPR